MNATQLALRIYEHLRNHPEKSFQRKEFYDPDHFVLPADLLPHTSEQKVRTAMRNILSMDSITDRRREDGTILYQYAVRDPAEQRRREERLGIIYAINRMQFKDLSFRVDHTEESIHLSHTEYQARWMSEAESIVRIAQSQRIHMDIPMLDQLIQLIQCRQRSCYANIFLIDENEEQRAEPLCLYPVRIIMQDGLFHCFGIIQTEENLTGDKFFLDEVGEVQEGAPIVQTQEFRELEGYLQTISEVPIDFT